MSHDHSLPGTPGTAAAFGAAASMQAPGLLDLRALNAFRAIAGAQQFEAIVGAAIQSYWNSARVMATLDADDVHREAHKVKGSAGSLGLCRIAKLAATLDTLTEAAGLPTLVGEMEAAIAASARELAAIGILAQTRAPGAQPEPVEA